MANPLAGAKRQPHLPIWRDAERLIVWAIKPLLTKSMADIDSHFVNIGEKHD